MLSDFEMIVRQFPAGDDVTIIPISDVHLGAAEHMARAVIAGKYGNGLARMLKLGTKYRAVQAEVNRLLTGK